jgi:hypothetical protein
MVVKDLNFDCLTICTQDPEFLSCTCFYAIDLFFHPEMSCLIKRHKLIVAQDQPKHMCL